MLVLVNDGIDALPKNSSVSNIIHLSDGNATKSIETNIL